MILTYTLHQVRAVDAGEQAAEQVPAEEPLHLPLPRLAHRQLRHVPARARQVHRQQHLHARPGKEAPRNPDAVVEVFAEFIV